MTTTERAMLAEIIDIRDYESELAGRYERDDAGTLIRVDFSAPCTTEDLS